jgi:hypothetical protein
MRFYFVYIKYKYRQRPTFSRHHVDSKLIISICQFYRFHGVTLFIDTYESETAQYIQINYRNIEGEISPYISQGEYAHSNRLSAI